MSKYEPEPYQSEGGFSVAGLPVLFAVLGVAAIVVGGLAGFISRWFYLIILFPAGVGLALAGVGYYAGQWAKMRNAGIALLAGLFAACLAMGTMHYVKYMNFKREVAEELRKANPNARPDPMAEQALREISFPRFMDLVATVGVTIGKRDSGFNLGYTGSWIYWSLELIGVAVLALLGTIAGAAQPFCSRCQSWKEEKKIGHLTGDPERAKAMLEKGNLDALHDQEPHPAEGHLQVMVASCPHCHDRSSLSVKLQQIIVKDKGETSTTDLVHLSYPGEALEDLEALFRAARPRRREVEEVEEVEDERDRPRRPRRDDDY